MKFIIFLFICQVYVTSCDLFDDARDQLDSLETTIKASILDTEISFISTIALVQESQKTFYSNELENLEAASNAVNSSFDLLQETAGNSTVDVSGCLTYAEILPTLYKLTSHSIRSCIDDSLQDLINLLTDSIYLVDIAYTAVQAVRHQLESCSTDDEDCAQSVLDTIAINVVNLPELISVNIDNFQDTLVFIQKSSKSCANSHFDSYINSTNITIEYISDCIDNAIGQLQ